MTIAMPVVGRLVDRFGARPLILLGLPILAITTWQMGALDLTTSDNQIRLWLAARGCAMGMVMMPVTAVSMDAIPRHLIPRATALSNVLRQLFGAFGSGMFATILIFREQLHQASLVQDVTPTNLAAIGILTATQTTMLEHGLSEAAARMAGLSTLMKQVSQTAQVQSFDDCFLIATMIALCGLLPALFLKRDHKPQAAPQAGAAE
jgi:MFS family permease